MKHIDLFSGIGGFALAGTWVWGSEYENVGHSEIEKYPCKVYHNHFPESECLGDITKIDWTRFAGTIDLVTGGFPCQPHSVAGKRKGSGDERDLWSECVRAIREIRPRFALFENVPGIFSSNGGRFFERVLSDISASGYDCEWQVLSAAEVGAWHKRERVWIVSYPSCNNACRDSGEFPKSDEQQEDERQKERISKSRSASNVPNATLRQDDRRNRRVVADAASGREGLDTTIDAGGQDVSDAKSTERELTGDSRRGRNGFTDGSNNAANTDNSTTARQRIDSGEIYSEPESERPGIRYCPERWATEPCLGELVDGLSNALDVAFDDFLADEARGRAIRVAAGIPKRVDQLKSLGNAIVPQCAAVIMERIKENM